MKGERILHADDSFVALEGFARVIEAFGPKNDQKIVGTASSVKEVEKLLIDGLRPTVALVDNSFPKPGDGERAADLIKKMSPETIVVSVSADVGVKWGDYNIVKDFSGPQICEFLLNLKH